MAHLDLSRNRPGYALTVSIPTRWNDYDLLGHVNNVLYNRYLEITVLKLVDLAGVDWVNDPVVPFAAEVCVKFLKPLPFSDFVDCCLRVSRLGNTSLVYELAIFLPEADSPSATGHFVHVFVDRSTERPVPIPESARSVFSQYVVDG